MWIWFNIIRSLGPCLFCQHVYLTYKAGFHGFLVIGCYFKSIFYSYASFCTENYPCFASLLTAKKSVLVLPTSATFLLIIFSHICVLFCRSFGPILKLVNAYHAVGAQYWAVWALCNLTTVYSKYNNHSKSM